MLMEAPVTASAKANPHLPRKAAITDGMSDVIASTTTRTNIKTISPGMADHRISLRMRGGAARSNLLRRVVCPWVPGSSLRDAPE